MITINIGDFLLERLNNSFTKKQKSKARELFSELFDYYLLETSHTYPMIFHNTTFDNYGNIKKRGLNNNLNYFAKYDGELLSYGDGNPGISCKVNYKNVINRLYPDPEWIPLFNILDKLGNPNDFKRKNIDHDVILCLLMQDILKIDLNDEIEFEYIDDDVFDFIINESLFMWLYVKGRVSSDLIEEIIFHPDLIS